MVGSKPNLPIYLHRYKVSYSCRLTFITLSQRSGPYDGLNPRMSIACMDVCKLDIFVVFVYSLWKTSCILTTGINWIRDIETKLYSIPRICSAFNNVWSNIGYVAFGILFFLIVAIRYVMWLLCRITWSPCALCDCCVGSHDPHVHHVTVVWLSCIYHVTCILWVIGRIWLECSLHRNYLYCRKRKKNINDGKVSR